MKKSGTWWIGWLIDLPGVNAQEKTKEELVKSLITGAQDMLATEVPFEPGTEMTMVDVPEPAWIGQHAH
ncbi:MAG: type II toxin-antitoxin system HicB family antitoxin [Syntrophales bacterium]